MSFMKKEVVAIIPARGGSKRVPRKNIKLLHGKPLISYAIEAALVSKYINRVVVSTDDEEIAKTAKVYKAEVPFIRPAKLAQDTSTTLSVLQHAIKFLEEKEGYKPDLVVLLQPTSPFVMTKDIDKAIEKLDETKTNSCVSICEVSERPEWMYVFEENSQSRIKTFLDKTNDKNTRRVLSKMFRLNGGIYVVRKDILMKNNKIIDNDNCSAIVVSIESSVDIDRPIDFLIAEAIMKHINY